MNVSVCLGRYTVDFVGSMWGKIMNFQFSILEDESSDKAAF